MRSTRVQIREKTNVLFCRTPHTAINTARLAGLMEESVCVCGVLSDRIVRTQTENREVRVLVHIQKHITLTLSESGLGD